MDSIFGVMEAQKHIQFYGVSIIFSSIYILYIIFNSINILIYSMKIIGFYNILWKYNIALIF